MFIGYDFFGYKNGSVFQTTLCHPSYFEVEISNGILDEIYIDEDIEVTDTIEKPSGWGYYTVLDAKLQGNLEGGSVSAGGLVIEKIRFQRRESNELMWSDIAEVPYEPNEKMLYEAIDKYVRNSFLYQYSILPITATVLGSRNVSNDIKVDFDGVFLSDKNHNYKLTYNIEYGDITHNNPSSILEPLNAKYPIISYSNLDYRSGEINALFATPSTVDNHVVDVRMEQLGRNQLINFIKNRKPKILRTQNGDMLLISITGDPRESYLPINNGIANISFSFVEIGDTSSRTLALNDMLVGLEEVF